MPSCLAFLEIGDTSNVTSIVLSPAALRAVIRYVMLARAAVAVP